MVSDTIIYHLQVLNLLFLQDHIQRWPTVYEEILQYFIPSAERLFENAKFLCQQDLAAADSAKTTTALFANMT